MAGRRLEANNQGKERRDYIKEALDQTLKDVGTLRRSTFVEKTQQGWSYRLDTVKTYLNDMILKTKDDSRLNLSKDRTTTVMALQIVLFKAGYMGVGHIDARWGSYTQGCMQKFEQEHGIKKSVYPTREMIQKLLTVAEQKNNMRGRPTTTGGVVTSPRRVETVRQSVNLVEQNTTTVRNAFKGLGKFIGAEQYFQFNSGKEFIKNGKKCISFLGKEYEQYSDTTSLDGSVKYQYHNANDYVIIGMFEGGTCISGVKYSQDGVVEKGSFGMLSDVLQSGERLYPKGMVERGNFNEMADGSLINGKRIVNGRVTMVGEQAGLA